MISLPLLSQYIIFWTLPYAYVNIKKFCRQKGDALCFDTLWTPFHIREHIALVTVLYFIFFLEYSLNNTVVLVSRCTGK